MKTKDVKVISMVDGKELPAKLLVCQECNNETFRIFVVNGRHNHMQCEKCEVSYCNQKCGEEEEWQA